MGDVVKNQDIWLKKLSCFNHKFSISLTLFLLLLLSLPYHTMAEETISEIASKANTNPKTPNIKNMKKHYVSDQLSVALRTGASNQYRILNFLKSGTQLEIIAISDQGDWYQVKAQGDQIGWIKSAETMPTPSAHTRLKNTLIQFNTTKEENSLKSEKIENLKLELASTHNLLDQMKKKYSDQKNKYRQLKKTSSNAVKNAQENNKLRERIENLLAEREELKAVNAILRGDKHNEGIAKGAFAVAFGVFITLLLPKITQRKRRDAWD